MPLTFGRDDVRRRVEFIGRGVVTGSDLVEAVERQALEGLWTYAALYDTTEVTTDPSSADLRRASDTVRRLLERYGPRGPVAMVAPADAIFGMGRMYEALTDERVTFRVFKTHEEAEQWLAAVIPPSAPRT